MKHYLDMDMSYGERSRKPVMCSMLEGHSKLVASDGTVWLWDTATGAEEAKSKSLRGERKEAGMTSYISAIYPKFEVKNTIILLFLWPALVLRRGGG